jgi:hypothetical protein
MSVPGLDRMSNELGAGGRMRSYFSVFLYLDGLGCLASCHSEVINSDNLNLIGVQ